MKCVRPCLWVLVVSLTISQAGCPAGTGYLQQPPWWTPPPSTLPYQRMSPNLVRVLASTSSDILGRCAQVNGDTVPGAVYCAKEVEQRALGTDLNHEGFRSYSQIVEVKNDDSVVVGPANIGAKVKVSQFSVVLEWGRWRTQRASGTPVNGRPFINAVDIGIAVLLSFQVSIVKADAQFRGSFGFGDLAAAIATGSVTIDVDIRDRGLKKSILPADPPTRLSSVEDFIKAITAFYDAIREVSLAYQKYASPAPNAAGAGGPPGPAVAAAVAPPERPKEAQPLRKVESLAGVQNPFTDKLPILAYYVSDLPDITDHHFGFTVGYLDGVDQVAQGVTCADSFYTLPRATEDQEYSLGLLRAYADLTSVTACEYEAPTDKAQIKARQYQTLRKVTK